MGTKLKTSKIGCSRREQPIARPLVPPIILTQQKFIDMKKVFFMAAILAVSGVMTNVSAQTTGRTLTNNNIPDDDYHKPNRCLKQQYKIPNVFYNSSTTILTLLFPSNGQGGKVEIYRNGAKVVNTKVPAGAMLNYALRDYGKGDYTIVVSQGNMVVYSKQVIVK